MLMKRQLEDAARCTIIDCEDCSIPCINTIEVTRRCGRAALAYREMLERLEWQSFAGEHGFTANCPMCGGAKPDVLGGGHEPDCELAALLKGSEDEEARDTVRLIETKPDYDGSAWECENCGELWEFECRPQENKYNYCPNCGVKFDEYVSYVDEEDEES